MPTTPDIARRLWELFAQPTPPLRKRYLQQLDQNPEAFPGAFRSFSPFDPAHVRRAAQISDQLEATSRQGESAEEGLSRTLDLFEELLAQESPDLLFYALEVFLTHYQGPVSFSIPSLTVREPELVTPSSVPGRPAFSIAVGSDEETRLDWFRESPYLNEHHLHWHLAYNSQRPLDRQGEMFLFMHQQMLARYDAERLASDVPRVSAYDDFSQPITVGYAPGPDERLSQFIAGGRNPDTALPRQVVQAQRSQLTAARRDIDNGVYDPTREDLTAETKALNAFGSTIESNRHPDADLTKPYASYHGWGHVQIASLNDGVMKTPVTALRDVVFWEWHKGMDDLYFRLQERLTPYDFSVDAPPVLLRKSVDGEGRPYSPDLIVCRLADVPGSGNATFDGASIGERAFGGGAWDSDFESGSFDIPLTGGETQQVKTTQRLQTSMRQGFIRYADPDDGTLRQYTYPYLVHEPFCYFLRLENTSLEIKKVTIRLFLCPHGQEEDRRFWMEMDKFLQELSPRSKTVVFRRDTESSVIRKPAVTDPAMALTSYDPTEVQRPSCACGWPYQLLLPKGSGGAGMGFQLMVMVSDAAIDLMETEADCGSFSFCAARQTDYPDRRPLGYPFNRPFSGAGTAIENTIRQQDNMASRALFIVHQ